MPGKLSIQVSPTNSNSSAGKIAAISLNRKAGVFEAPSTPKRPKIQTGANSVFHHPATDLKSSPLSPSKSAKNLMNNSVTLSTPVYKRGGTFSNQKRGLLNKSLRAFESSPTMSPALTERLQKLENYKESSQISASKMIEAINNKKDLEKQVLTMENRIKRLKFEDDVMLKKIGSTTEKTEKIMGNKKRHHEKLVQKVKKQNAQIEFVEKKKVELTQERISRVEMIRQSQDDMLKFKYDVGVYMRQANDMGFQQRIESERARVQRNIGIIERVRSSEREHQQSKQQQEDENREVLCKKYSNKLDLETKKASELESKLGNLAKLEEGLFAKLSQTQALHKLKYDELEKTFNIKVTASALEEGNTGASISKSKSDTAGKKPAGKSLGIAKSATVGGKAKGAQPEEVEEEEEGEEEEEAQEEEAQDEEAAEEAVEGEEEEAAEGEEVEEGEEEEVVEGEEEEEAVEEEEAAEEEEEVEYEEEEEVEA